MKELNRQINRYRAIMADHDADRKGRHYIYAEIIYNALLRRRQQFNEQIPSIYDHPLVPSTFQRQNWNIFKKLTIMLIP